jgi:hypothetical protein
VVRVLANRANASRVLEVLEQDPGRFKALYLLAGGTPRTLALLHTVLANDHGDRIERDLTALLDQLTPYYKARFDDLSAQHQLIVDKVALNWHPITAAECQAATRLDVNTVSAQLNRLVKLGIFAKVALPSPSKLGFQVAERLFNIWYLMRASRRLRRQLSWFVEFLRMFYGDQEVQRRAEALAHSAGVDARADPAKFLAFASAVADPALRRRLELQAVSLLLSEDNARLRAALDLEGEDAHLAPVVDRVRALRELRAKLQAAGGSWPEGHTTASVAHLLACAPTVRLVDKVGLAAALAGARIATRRRFVEWRARARGELEPALLEAIGSGELPALSDAMSPAEMTRIFELGGREVIVSTELVNARETFGEPLSDELLDHVFGLLVGPADGVVVAAIVLVNDGKWQRARHVVLRLLRGAAPDPGIGHMMAFMHAAIERGHATEAAQLLADADRAERWLPLYEATRAVAERSLARISSLAPEVRTVANLMFEALGGPAHLPSVEYRLDPAELRGGRASDSRAQVEPRAHKPRRRRRKA